MERGQRVRSSLLPAFSLLPPSRPFPPTLNNCRYMFTVANARQITEREVEEALNALYVAYGSPPVYAHD